MSMSANPIPAETRDSSGNLDSSETLDSSVTTAPSPWLRLPGAVAAEGADSGVAWHYGDPVAEQRMLERGAGAVDLSHRGVLTVTGPDRLSWLHSLTSQFLTGLAPGVGTEALVLSPHGHVEHALHLVDDGATTWITVEPGSSAALFAWLDRMRFMLRVEVSDVTAEWAVVGQPIGDARPPAPADPGAADPGAADPDVDGLVDGDAAGRLDAGGAGEGPRVAAVWVDPWPAVAPGGVSYASGTDHPPFAWREVIVARADLEAARAVLAVDGVAGTWAAEALRVAAWRPRLGFETDHRTIPHEVDWLRTAVHLQKGCYRGQETVARVHNLGRPPRRLVFLHLDGSEHVVPPTGAPVVLGEREVGRVTSVARHHELGPIALAVVKRNTPADAALLVEGIAAAQETIVTP
jgi:folate-binding protein YgfZ